MEKSVTNCFRRKHWLPGEVGQLIEFAKNTTRGDPMCIEFWDKFSAVVHGRHTARSCRDRYSCVVVSQATWRSSTSSWNYWDGDKERIFNLPSQLHRTDQAVSSEYNNPRVKTAMNWLPSEIGQLITFAEKRPEADPMTFDFWQKFSLVTNGSRTAIDCKDRYSSIVGAHGRPFLTMGAKLIGNDPVISYPEEEAAQSNSAKESGKVYCPSKDQEGIATVQPAILMLQAKKPEEIQCLNVAEESVDNTSSNEYTSPNEAKKCEEPAGKGNKEMPYASEGFGVLTELQTKEGLTSSIEMSDENDVLPSNQPQAVINDRKEIDDIVFTTDQAEAYCNMYNSVKAHKSSDMREMQLIAGNIHRVVQIIYNFIGSPSVANEEDILLNIIKPNVIRSGDEANFIRLLMFSIYSSYSFVKFIDRLGSIGLKCSVPLQQRDNPKGSRMPKTGSEVPAKGKAVVSSKLTSNVPMPCPSAPDEKKKGNEKRKKSSSVSKETAKTQKKKKSTKASEK